MFQRFLHLSALTIEPIPLQQMRFLVGARNSENFAAGAQKALESQCVAELACRISAKGEVESAETHTKSEARP